MKGISPVCVGFSPERLKRVDAVMQRHVQEGRISGIINLVARHRQVVHLVKAGWRDVEARKPMTLDTLFRVYSQTKTVTSAAVMMLYEQGCFLLTDPVSKFIPEFGDVKVFVHETGDGVELVDPERPVTIYDLLVLTAGTSYEDDEDDYISQQYKKRVWTPYRNNLDITLEELVKGIARCPLRFQPGSDTYYGVDYEVLGYLVQVVSGQPFETFLQERIFEPLGMVDTAFAVPPPKLDRLAVEYRPATDGGIEIAPELDTCRAGPPTRCPQGGGGLISTIGDWYRFCQMLFNKGELGGVRLLGRKTVELMTANHWRDGMCDGTPARGWGLGVGVRLDVERDRRPGSVGTYGWGGWASTRYRIDPKEALVHIQMAQLSDNRVVPILDQIEVAIYQAIVD